MAVKIRLKRLGRHKRPFYRIAVMDGRTRRDGAPIEELGHYDPLAEDDETRVVLDAERAEYWLSVGAQPSDTVASFIRDAGVVIPWETEEYRQKRREKRRKRRASRRKARGEKKGPQPKRSKKKKKKSTSGEEKAAEAEKLSRAEKKQIEKAGG